MMRPHFVVVGLGSIGRRHATNLAALAPDARFTFVRQSGSADEVTARFDARVVRHVADAIDDDVDLAVVSTPSACHIDALPPLVARACPILVEKPVVATTADADRLASLLAESPSATRVAGFNLRFLPSLRRVRRLIANGDLGTLVRATFIAGQWLPDWRPGVDYRTVYSADAALGGGVELDLSHEIDAARWLLGELTVAFARGGTLTSLDLRSNDTSVAVLAPPEAPGPLATVALDYVSRRRVRWYEVVGELGRVQWDLDGRLELATVSGNEVLADAAAEFDVGATYVEMARGVIAAAAAGAVAPSDLATFGLQSLDDGLASTRLALQVRDQGGRV